MVQHISLKSSKKHAAALSKLKDAARIFKKAMGGVEGSQEVNMKALLQEGDRLVILSGQRNILMTDESLGITSEEMHPDDTVTMEGMIAPGSNLIGQFVDTFNNAGINRAQIIAVHRLVGKINEDFSIIKLSMGDTVLIKGEEADLAKLFEGGQIINLIKPVQEPYKKKHAPIAIAALFIAVALATVDVMPIAGGAFVAAILVMITGCIKVKDAYRSLQGSVLFLIYAMLAISIAMEKTGALKLVVDNIMRVVSDLPPAAVLSIIYLMTSIITEIFSNNAAAVMLTPIAVGMAQTMGVDPRPFVVAVMLGASASFATPVGYQTNTLVFQAGNYQFKDFLKVGIPMNLLMWAVASFVIPWYWEM